jgi:hypothetical protein
MTPDANNPYEATIISIFDGWDDIDSSALAGDTTTAPPPPTTTKPPPPKPTPTVSYDCKGSGLCGSALNFVRHCDHAANTLRRGENYYYSTA